MCRERQLSEVITERDEAKKTYDVNLGTLKNNHEIQQREDQQELREVGAERDRLREQLSAITHSRDNWRGLAGEWQDVARSKTSRISELTAQLSSLQSQEAPWVEIKEGCEMPDENQDILYIVTGTEERLRFVVRGNRNHDGQDWWWCDMDGEFDDTGNDGDASYVSHWMPTPVAPQESKSDAGEATDGI
jgi:hypothetical protein